MLKGPQITRYGRRDALAAACSATSAGRAVAPLAAAAQDRASHVTGKVLYRPDAPSIAYDDLGGGEAALLFMPGWCVGRKVFASLPKRCSEQLRVLALDWRGHGDSGAESADFGDAQLVEDAIDLIRATRLRRVVPVALAHSGWIALELRRRLGATIDRIVLIDWLVTDPPAPFLSALVALQDRSRWQAARDQLFSTWLQGVGRSDLEEFIHRDMGVYDFAMWSRAAREISRAYREYRSPLSAMATLAPAMPVLHVYAQPSDSGFLAAQSAYAAAHPWFHVRRLAARSHFPMFEVPEELASVIDDFVS